MKSGLTGMNKLRVCILFGGMSPEHEVSLRSAESVLNQINREKYHVLPVGITKKGDWMLYGGEDHSMIPTGAWEAHPGNCRVALSPVRGQGLLRFRGNLVICEQIDVIFPVLHGLNGEDGTIQGLMQLAGIPYVGPHICASAMAMDKAVTKRLAEQAGIHQAEWQAVSRRELKACPEQILSMLENRFRYPMFIKPAKGGSSLGISKASDREQLKKAMQAAAELDRVILVEECILGREIEVAVMGNDCPVTSVCGEIDSGAQFYDYEAKYLTETSVAYIPARIREETSETVRDTAVRIYTMLGCRGMARVDFFVTYDENRVVFNEINTLPGFTSISMFPRLFEAGGISCSALIDELLRLAMEAFE